MILMASCSICSCIVLFQAMRATVGHQLLRAGSAPLARKCLVQVLDSFTGMSLGEKEMLIGECDPGCTCLVEARLARLGRFARFGAESLKCWRLLPHDTNKRTCSTSEAAVKRLKNGHRCDVGGAGVRAPLTPLDDPLRCKLPPPPRPRPLATATVRLLCLE